MFMKEMSNIHTYTTHTPNYLFGVVKYLLQEGRRDYEVGLWYGVRMKHMITLESIEFNF